MDFLNNKENIKKVVARIAAKPLTETSHLYADKIGKIPIGEATKMCLQNIDPTDFYPAIILIRVVLAANRNYKLHVEGNLKRIKKDHQDLRSLDDLEQLLKSKTSEEFYKFWGHKNHRKYTVLTRILKEFKSMMLKYGDPYGEEVMKLWANNFKISNIKNDPIGKIPNVALATIQHLRMDLGVDTVKPDQRVMEVIEREFAYKKVSQRQAIKCVEEIAKITGNSVRELDMIFVNYGSGYYDNRKFGSEYLLKVDLARKMLSKGIDKDLISEITGLNYAHYEIV